jgi:hypothetical protein
MPCAIFSIFHLEQGRYTLITNPDVVLDTSGERKLYVGALYEVCMHHKAFVLRFFFFLSSEFA